MADDIKKITGAVEDAVTYPILTQEIGSSPAPASAGGAGRGGGASLGRITQDTMRQLLGWRYRTDDIKGFTAALTKAFALKQVGDHTEWDLRPQNYMIQADLGEITGAQASIYTRAKVALDQILPLLDGLTPLRPDFVQEDLDAMRMIVRTELSELVAELGAVAGPRIQRVDSFFSQLLGPNPVVTDPEQVRGQLRQLKERFGFQRERVNTIADEQDLTNFLIIVDYINSLFITWKAQRDFFAGIGQPFLGTQLVLLSQDLDALAETVQQAYDAMDSVFFGAAERQATELYFHGEPRITVAELLGWVEEFAANEGRQLLQDADKDGVVAFRTTVNRLRFLVHLAYELSQTGSANPDRGFHTARTQRALQAIGQFLRSTEEDALDIKRGAIDDEKPHFPPVPSTFALHRIVRPPSHSPALVSPNSNVYFEAAGEAIRQEANVRVISLEHPDRGFDVRPSTVKVSRDGTTISAEVDLSKAKPGEEYTLVVQNPDGQYAWLPRAFAIVVPVAPPTDPQSKIMCENDAIPALSVSVPPGITVDWYADDEGGDPLPKGEDTLAYTPQKAQTSTYYAEARNPKTEQVSPIRTPVQLTVNPQPDAPLNPQNADMCPNANIPALSVTVPQNFAVDWYADSEGGTPLNGGTDTPVFTPTARETKTYYAGARDRTTGCVSRSRTAVQLSVNPQPPPPTNPMNRIVKYDDSYTPPLEVSVANNFITVDWYANQEPQPGEVPLTGGAGVCSFTPPQDTDGKYHQSATFYAEARDMKTNCVSAARTPVTLTVFTRLTIKVIREQNAIKLHAEAQPAVEKFEWKSPSGIHETQCIPANENGNYTVTIHDKATRARVSESVVIDLIELATRGVQTTQKMKA